MATANRTHPSTPPDIGKRASVRIDTELHDDLAILMRNGTTLSDAVRQAVGLLADAYRRAWDHGDVSDGTAPRIIAVRYALSDGSPEDVPRPSDTSYPRVREAPASATTPDSAGPGVQVPNAACPARRYDFPPQSPERTPKGWQSTGSNPRM